MARTSKKKNTAAKRVNAKASGKNAKPITADKYRIREEIIAICLIALGVFLAFGMYFSAAGKFGTVLSGGLKGLFGYVAFSVPIIIVIYGVLLLIGADKLRGVRPIVFTFILFVLFNVLLSGHYLAANGSLPGAGTVSAIFDLSKNGDAGGITGMFLASIAVKYLGKIGLYLLSGALIIIFLILFLKAPMSRYARALKDKTEPRREERRQRREERAAERAAWAEQEAYEYEEDYVDGETGELLDSDDYPDSYETTARELLGKTDAYVPSARGNSILSFLPSFLGGTRDERPSEKTPQDKILDLVQNDEIYGDGVDGDIPAPEPEFADSNLEVGLEPAVDRPEGFGLLPDDADLGDTFEDIPVTAAELLEDDVVPVKKKAAPAKKKPAEKLETFAPIGNTFGEAAEGTYANYKLPPTSLLKANTGKAKVTSESALRTAMAKLEQILRDFKVDARVTDAIVGPTVTRYEVEPDLGVKIQSIKTLESDLALKLEVKSVRVVPIPGKGVVGIEAYNANMNVVTLRELIESSEFVNNPSMISFALGKNISGKNIVTDLKEMPHLLIAGTTGSGKSVCINSILLSILYHATPEQVKLILVDPKVVELKLYNDIPHLLVPVVTEPERAAMALGYAVSLMNDRYKKFAEHNVRNLDGFNGKMREEGTTEEVMPEIVIVIDELSDLMMVASAKVQESISRLAAMARAAGMHLIVATQQPLASILTSVIKANIPSRIAFSVSSNSSSRVILDDGGAERLLGKGDMLFSPVGTREPMRIQGSFVSDDEIRKVTDFVKKQADPDYNQDVVQAVSGSLNQPALDEEDDLFMDAVEMAAASKTGTVSVSMIQRRFRVGYNRAARLVDMMEELGIVGPSDGTNKPRQIVMTEAQIQSFLYPEGDLLSGLEVVSDNDNSGETTPSGFAGHPSIGGEYDVPFDLDDEDF
ncbi:MAG: DNA translocase FtsK [Clostridiales Family XIII bacterium]|jgi:S-DNA-T family DNA segregation ATPase FtsK/SpoIIIE|nr:DNA translocase FtsK [Clostridiales Family XIII bacterium]